MNISSLLELYISDILLSIVIIVGAILLCKLLGTHFKKKSFKRTKTIVVYILISILVLSLLIEIWKDKSKLINTLSIYKGYLPGYDTIIMLITAAVLSHFIQIWLLHHSDNTNNDLSKRHKMRLVAKWISWSLFIAASGVILIIQRGWDNVATFLGLIGAGLALSMQETILCLIGWIYIIFNHTYDIGDRIEMNNQLGDVIGITPTHTRLLEVSMKIQGGQSTGRILTIPNSQVFRNPVFNSTIGFPFIWIEVSTIVTFASDIELAIETMLNVAKNSTLKIEPEVMKDITTMQDEYAIHYKHLTPTVYSRLVDNGVKLTLRFLSPVRSSRQREHDISLNILKSFRKTKHVNIAYNTTRIYSGNEEDVGEFHYSSPIVDITKN